MLRAGGGSFYYENRGVPTLQSDRDVIVRVVATGLCGSDVRLSLLFIIYIQKKNFILTDLDPLLATRRPRPVHRRPRDPSGSRILRRGRKRGRSRPGILQPPVRRPGDDRAGSRLQHLPTVPRGTVQPLPHDELRGDAAGGRHAVQVLPRSGGVLLQAAGPYLAARRGAGRAVERCGACVPAGWRYAG